MKPAKRTDKIKGAREKRQGDQQIETKRRELTLRHY